MKWKWTLWIIGLLMIGAIACVIFVQNRGGHYPAYPAAGFAGLSPAVSTGATPGEPVVQTVSGVLRGRYVGATQVFRGIPYAHPPVGPLRWQAPLPPDAWAGERAAVQPGTSCTQRPPGLATFFDPMAQAYGARFEQPPIESGEDCLYLDVWVPPKAGQQALPVMVWLHGGSNTVGSGTQTTYDGLSLSQRGVVVVTLNYRLGIMGFFSHPELTKESPHQSSGNYGLLDQLAALEWVKQNIAQFGGDPGNVTLFGESAGGIDATRLMASPLSAGLFRRVIAESGPSFDQGKTLAEAEAFGNAVSALLPADLPGTSLEKLRSLPATEIDKLAGKAKERSAFDNTAATVDGWVLPRSPQQAFLQGTVQKVDLMIGLNGREFSAFRLAAAAAEKATGVKSGADSGALKRFSDAARPYFGPWTYPVIGMYLSEMLFKGSAGLDQATNDLIGACPVGAIASLTNALGQHVFVYRFDRIVPGQGAKTLGAFHSLEVPYVFGTLHDREWLWLPSTADDAALSNLIQVYWTNFAKSGDPNAAGLPSWPVFTDDAQEFMVVNPDASVSAQHNFEPLFSHLRAAELETSFKSR